MHNFQRFLTVVVRRLLRVQFVVNDVVVVGMKLATWRDEGWNGKRQREFESGML